MPSANHSLRPSPRVKGIAFRSVLTALEKLRGNDVKEQVLGRLPVYLADGARYGTIVAASWYPIEWYRELLDAIVKGTGEGERVIREVGREAARADITSVYRTVFRMASPQAIFSLSARLFSTYYDTGTVRVIESREGFVQARWSGCTGFDRNLWLEIIAACEMYLELAGGKHVRSRILDGGTTQDTHMEAQAHWA